MTNKLNKKAITHIEVIISFVIFVGFIIFLFIFLKPLKNQELSPTILDSSEYEIDNYANVNYSYISVKLNDSSLECFILPIKMGKVVVNDEDKHLVSAESIDEEVYVLGIKRNFYAIYSSLIFNENSFVHPDYCPRLTKDNYTLGLLRETKVLSYDRLVELKERYNQDYKNLKKEFNIPESNNFGFSVRESNGNKIITALNKQPSKINIIARDVPSQLLYTNGTIKYVIMNIQAW